MNRTLYRSTKNKVFAGVCGGLGDYFSVDPVLIRIIFVLAIFVAFPAAFLGYLVLWIVVPLEVRKNMDDSYVKPAEVVDTPNQTQTVKKPDNSSAVLSIGIAAILILLGIAILMPGGFFRIWDFGFYITGTFLILAGGKILYDQFFMKEYNLVRSSIAVIIATYGIFLILNRANLVSYGIYWEYTKNLLPALLILAGVGLIFKNIPNKMAATAVGIFILLFVGVYSFINGNYSPFDWMRDKMGSFHMQGKPFWQNQGKNFTVSKYDGSIKMPDNIESVSFNIENTAGNMEISSGENLLDYESQGLAPAYSTNLNGKILNVRFANQAGESKIKIGGNKPSVLSLQLSAGNMEADLKPLDIKDISATITGGSFSLKIPSGVRTLRIQHSVGNSQIELPKDARIHIKLTSAAGYVNIPSEFKQKDGEYFYDGGSTNEMRIEGSMSMGNLEFRF